MADDERANLRLVIAHVLFMDIVGYSKLLLDEQAETLFELNRIVRETDAVREAEAAGQITLLPTGDGIALVFTSSVEVPVECALQIARSLRTEPSLPLRMGIHSGPVQHVRDVNGRANVAGAGINIAQRVMDCGDAGHILVSKRVADDLAPYRRWQPYLHDLGDCTVKHGLTVSLVNLYADVVGNPVPPLRFDGEKADRKSVTAGASPKVYRSQLATAAAFLAAVALGLAAYLWITMDRWPAATRPDVRSASGSHRALQGPFLDVPEKSIAVLPFESFSSDKENAFFADGIQDEILTDLAKVADLKVISRTSVLAFRAGGARNTREIGQALGVAHLLEGSVQRDAGTVRVTAQLIDARTDSHLWAEHYDRELRDVFKIQTEVAERIVGSLQATLSPVEKAVLAAPPTADVEAFDLYLRANQLVDGFADSADWRDPLLKAIGLIDAAIARDPDFALAYCVAARAHDDLYWFELDHTPARLAQAQAAVTQALRLRPHLGEAHLAQALVLYHGARDYPAALRELEIARSVLPNDAQVFSVSSWIERRQGKWAESLRDQEQAVTLDPRNPSALTDLTVLYDLVRRYADENRVADNAIQAVPLSASYFELVKAQLQIETGQLVAANAVMAKIPPSYDPSGAATFTRMQIALYNRHYADAAAVLSASKLDGFVGSTGIMLPRAWLEGLMARAAGQTEQCKTAFLSARGTVGAAVQARPDDASSWALLGEIDAGLGRKEEALREGAKAVELRPTSADAVEGPAIETMLALIKAWTGDRDNAVDRLTLLSSTPGGPHYGDLRLDPAWDVLKGDERFEKMLADMKPVPVDDNP